MSIARRIRKVISTMEWSHVGGEKIVDGVGLKFIFGCGAMIRVLWYIQKTHPLNPPL